MPLIGVPLTGRPRTGPWIGKRGGVRIGCPGLRLAMLAFWLQVHAAVSPLPVHCPPLPVHKSVNILLQSSSPEHEQYPSPPQCMAAWLGALMNPRIDAANNNVAETGAAGLRAANDLFGIAIP
jgi:hypothetical protein